MLEIALEVGLYEIGWQEIEAWSRVTGTELSPWEANTIKRMSIAYTGAVSKFSGNDLPQPWHDGFAANRKQIAEATKRTLRK